MRARLSTDYPRGTKVLVIEVWYFGTAWRRMTDNDGTIWLAGVIWYPRTFRRLGYVYPSLRWF